MRWPLIRLTRPRPTGRPQPSGWCVDNKGCVGANWYEIDGSLVRQCDDCGHVLAVVRQRSSGIDATCSTDNRPAEDWPGCTD